MRKGAWAAEFLSLTYAQFRHRIQSTVARVLEVLILCYYTQRMVSSPYDLKEVYVLYHGINY